MANSCRDKSVVTLGSVALKLLNNIEAQKLKLKRQILSLTKIFMTKHRMVELYIRIILLILLIFFIFII